VPSPRTGLGREVGIDVEKARAGDVAREVELTTAAWVTELPAAVDEPVADPVQPWCSWMMSPPSTTSVCPVT
jgi:hypothetical protein